MDGKGRVIDSIMVERQRRVMRYENPYIGESWTVDEVLKGLRKYFWFYEDERTHQSHGGNGNFFL